jgi:hypothetical protein
MPVANARLDPVLAPDPGTARIRPEDAVLILFICLYPLLRKALDRAEYSRRDAYLASATDMGELERRMNLLEI